MRCTIIFRIRLENINFSKDSSKCIWFVAVLVLEKEHTDLHLSTFMNFVNNPPRILLDEYISQLFKMIWMIWYPILAGKFFYLSSKMKCWILIYAGHRWPSMRCVEGILESRLQWSTHGVDLNMQVVLGQISNPNFRVSSPIEGLKLSWNPSIPSLHSPKRLPRNPNSIFGALWA